jgi:hypothetical protein
LGGHRNGERGEDGAAVDAVREGEPGRALGSRGSACRRPPPGNGGRRGDCCAAQLYVLACWPWRRSDGSYVLVEEKSGLLVSHKKKGGLLAQSQDTGQGHVRTCGMPDIWTPM